MPKISLASVRSQVTPQTLQILLAVEQQGNLARAAQQVNLVPSAVSRRIADLESIIGTRLLRRTPQGVEFTAAGSSVLVRARTILKEIDGLADELSAFAEGTRGTVRLACSVFALLNRLPVDIATFRREYPQVILEFRSRSSLDVVNDLLKGDIDVGVIAAHEVPPGLSAKVYDEDALCLLAPDGHPLARCDRVITLADIAAFEIVSMPKGTETFRLLQDQARRRGLQLRSSVEVASLDAMVLMTQAGLGIAIVPSRAWEALGPFKGLRRIQIHEHWAHRQVLVAMNCSTATASPAGRLFSRLAANSPVSR